MFNPLLLLKALPKIPCVQILPTWPVSKWPRHSCICRTQRQCSGACNPCHRHWALWEDTVQCSPICSKYFLYPLPTYTLQISILLHKSEFPNFPRTAPKLQCIMQLWLVSILGLLLYRRDSQVLAMRVDHRAVEADIYVLTGLHLKFCMLCIPFPQNLLW